MSVKTYCNGKIPAGIWLLSSLVGAVFFGAGEILLGETMFNATFFGALLGIFIRNLLYTIPLFLFQAHFICTTLQKNKKNVMNVMLIILITGWTLMALAAWWMTEKVPGTGVMKMIMWIVFIAVALTWNVM